MEVLWHKACNHFAVPEDVAKSWYARINQRLNECQSKRYYHNWNEMMQHKQEHLQHFKPALLLAAFFQYYSYDGIQPCAKGNCAAFEEFCCDAALDDQESKNLILKLLGDNSAENELSTTYEDDANLLQDLDLVILAANTETYKRYCQLLRREYEHMADEEYKSMRLKPKVDETPVIRNKLKSVVFKKFRDNTERRLDLRKKRLNRKSFDGDTTSDSQRITKKLLRSIKRRHLQNPYNLMQVQRENMLKRRLHLTNTSTKVLKPTISHNVTIEEGEIISDDEVNHSQTKKALNTKPSATSAVETDDDCICIEPQIEQIVIDDDLPETSRSKRKNNISSGYVSLLQGINDRDSKHTNKLVTSTPYGEGSKRPAVRNSTQCNENGIGDLTGLFYEDVSIINPLETIISEDTFTNYTKMSTLVGEERKAKKKKRIGNKSQKQSADISKDFLTLDETLKLENPNEEENEKEVTQTDDSVIFISETVVRSDKPAPMMDYVPLSSNDVPNPIFVPKSPPRPPRLAAIKSGLFTNSEKKQLDAYNDNTYNPNADDPKAREKRTSKRLILIDGCNVAFNHSLNREFSVKGLKICIDFFEKLGHEVKAVLPQFRMHRCSDSAAMTELRNAGKIVVTPCKNLPGMFSSSYDDRFILQLAAEMDAVIVSNDNYRDLINENRAFKKLIENRVIGFTWCNDLFMVAKDPYGKWGPPLHIILNRT